MVSFRGPKKRGLCPDRFLFRGWGFRGLIFKISDEHPHSFHMQSPPPLPPPPLPGKGDGENIDKMHKLSQVHVAGWGGACCAL